MKGILKEEFLKAPTLTPETARRVDEGFEKGEFTGVVVMDKELRIIQESSFTLDLVMKMPSALGKEKVTIPMRQEITTSLVSFRQLR